LPSIFLLPLLTIPKSKLTVDSRPNEFHKVTLKPRVVKFRALRIYDGVHRIPAVDEYTLAALSDCLSIMAVDSITNKLLGVAVNGLSKAGEDITSRHTSMDAENKFGIILAILRDVNSRAPEPLRRELAAGDVFDIRMVTTDKMNRRSGLGTDLIRRSVSFILGFCISAQFIPLDHVGLIKASYIRISQ